MSRTEENKDNAVIRFRLAGRSRAFDPARQAIRPDLADVAEAETHFAPHYAEPVTVVATTATGIFASRDGGEETLGQLEAGAQFALLDVTGEWAWGYRIADHLVGYVRDADLSSPANL